MTVRCGTSQDSAVHPDITALTTCAILTCILILQPASSRSLGNDKSSPGYEMHLNQPIHYLLEPSIPWRGKESGLSGDTDEEDIFLMVVVCSQLNHSEHRYAIRNTWANELPTLGEGRVSYMFLVGTDVNGDADIQRRIAKESDDHDDILQINIVDLKETLSYKSIAMLKYVSDCRTNVKYLLKLDDDTFINIHVLIQQLQSTTQTYFIMGDIIAGAQPIRDKDYKWYTPTSLFEPSIFPTYLSGAAYVISGDLFKALYQATHTTPFFWIEDIFITAMCAKTTKAHLVFNGKFYNRRPTNDPCVWKDVISVHRVTPDELKSTWQRMGSTDSHC